MYVVGAKIVTEVIHNGQNKKRKGPITQTVVIVPKVIFLCIIKNKKIETKQNKKKTTNKKKPKTKTKKHKGIGQLRWNVRLGSWYM